MSVVYYEGERIYFRPIELDDEPLLRRWVNDPRVWAMLGNISPFNALREREWIENLGKSGRDYVFGIVARDTDQMIGTAGLHNVHVIDHRAVFGIMIGEVEAQNQGYGYETVRLMLRYGFEQLNLNRIELSVHANNPRAIHVYEKAGFELEGRQRQGIFRDGRYIDVLRYAILREAWSDELVCEAL